MKRLAYLIPAISLVVAMLAAHSASAAVSAPSMVGTIHGGGTANMTDLVAAGFKGVSSFGFEATLFPTARPEGTSTALTTWATFPGTRATSSATLRDGHRTPTEPSPCSLLMGRSSGPTAASSRMVAWLLL